MPDAKLHSGKGSKWNGERSMLTNEDSALTCRHMSLGLKRSNPFFQLGVGWEEGQGHRGPDKGMGTQATSERVRVHFQ